MRYVMADILEIKNLTKIYGQGKENLCILQNVNLTVARGTFAVLLGPSGSGKSTLLNLIGMLDQPTSGEIWLEGQNITQIKNETNRAQKLLDQLGVGSLIHKMPADLSGGEKQRAAIARALCNKPDLLLADEPTGNLDAARKEQIFKDFAALAKEGLTVLMVTHDVHAAHFADVVYTLERKQLVRTK